jgi:hypothetical protein
MPRQTISSLPAGGQAASTARHVKRFQRHPEYDAPPLRRRVQAFQSVVMREWVRVSFMVMYTSSEQAMQPVTYQ